MLQPLCMRYLKRRGHRYLERNLVYNGSSFSCAFVLSADGTYAEATYKDGSLSSTETGTYEVKGSKVILHENGNMGTSTVYKYKGGKLVNNGHEFTKE